MEPNFGEDRAEISRMERLYLSKGGRVTLVKNTLSNLPT